MRLRILISTAIGLASGFFCWFVLSHFRLGAGDFSWAIAAARDLLAGKNPYLNSSQLYPLTAAPFGLPFAGLRPEISGGIFYGVSSALLAFGLTRKSYGPLLVFMAYPYWAGILTAQWSPLIMAGAFLPLALPAAMAKPQIGLPVMLTFPSRRGWLACLLILLATLIVRPRWPLLWISTFRDYKHFIPLLVFPGMLLLLAALRWRDRDARLLLLMAIMPQRWFYDSFILWLIPKTRREIIWTAFLSWGAGIWRWYHVPESAVQVGRWTVICIYLPMLCAVLLRFRTLAPGAPVKTDLRQ